VTAGLLIDPEHGIIGIGSGLALLPHLEQLLGGRQRLPPRTVALPRTSADGCGPSSTRCCQLSPISSARRSPVVTSASSTSRSRSASPSGLRRGSAAAARIATNSSGVSQSAVRRGLRGESRSTNKSGSPSRWQTQRTKWHRRMNRRWYVAGIGDRVRRSWARCSTMAPTVSRTRSVHGQRPTRAVHRSRSDRREACYRRGSRTAAESATGRALQRLPKAEISLLRSIWSSQGRRRAAPAPASPHRAVETPRASPRPQRPRLDQPHRAPCRAPGHRGARAARSSAVP
jgi:hypothetical protein